MPANIKYELNKYLNFGKMLIWNLDRYGLGMFCINYSKNTTVRLTYIFINISYLNVPQEEIKSILNPLLRLSECYMRLNNQTVKRLACSKGYYCFSLDDSDSITIVF